MPILLEHRTKLHKMSFFLPLWGGKRVDTEKEMTCMPKQVRIWSTHQTTTCLRVVKGVNCTRQIGTQVITSCFSFETWAPAHGILRSLLLECWFLRILGWRISKQLTSFHRPTPLMLDVWYLHPSVFGWYSSPLEESSFNHLNGLSRSCCFGSLQPSAAQLCELSSKPKQRKTPWAYGATPIYNQLIYVDL